MRYKDEDGEAAGSLEGRREWRQEGAASGIAGGLIPVFPRVTAAPQVIKREREKEADLANRRPREAQDSAGGRGSSRYGGGSGPVRLRRLEREPVRWLTRHPRDPAPGRRQPRKYVKARWRPARSRAASATFPGGDADSKGWRQERASLYRRSDESARERPPLLPGGRPARRARQARVASRRRRAASPLRSPHPLPRRPRDSRVDPPRQEHGRRPRRTGRRRFWDRAPRPARRIQHEAQDDLRPGRVRAGGAPVAGRPDAPASGHGGSLFRTGLLSTAPVEPLGLHELEAGLVDHEGRQLEADRWYGHHQFYGGGGTIVAGGHGRVSILPNADRAGVPTNRKVIRFVRQVSALAGSR
jgi:hypothetical protein